MSSYLIVSALKVFIPYLEIIFLFILYLSSLQIFIVYLPLEFILYLPFKFHILLNNPAVIANSVELEEDVLTKFVAVL